MASNEELRKRLAALAHYVTNEQADLSKQAQLEERLHAKTASADSVKETLAEVLHESRGTVQTKLAEHTDSDRLIREIVNELNTDKK